MKKVIFSLLLVAALLGLGMVFFTDAFAAASTLGPSYHEQSDLISRKDSTLYQIEARIKQAFIQSMVSKEATSLQEVQGSLQRKAKEAPNNLIQYWLSYSQYYECIFQLQMEDEKAAKKAIEAAIDGLEDMNAKNGEDYALLAMVHSMSISFKNPMRAPLISQKVKKYAKTALSSDSTNIRAHYVLASNDFYTPKQYGGGRKTAYHLKKALAFPAQQMANPMLPAWGKEEAHEMLVKYYIREKRWEEAKEAFQAAIMAYPDNYTLSRLGTKLVGK